MFGQSTRGRSRDTIALMISQAYKPVGARASVAEYNYVPQLSNQLFAVYLQPKTLDAVLAFRGTQLDNKEDLIADSQIVAGRYTGSSRDKEVDYLVTRALNGLRGVRSVLFTGHSLGGRESWEAFSRRSRNRTYTWRGYNSAPLGSKYNSFVASGDRRTEAIRTRFDLVSAPDAYVEGTRNLEGGSHGLASFTKPM